LSARRSKAMARAPLPFSTSSDHSIPAWFARRIDEAGKRLSAG
jgi:hypothetical protein